ncbi:DUF1624 domain-containing protein [Azospirillum rugosum]|uniref:Membrane protein n=1 Tax=Azospirillum rugosum TaxID=416170 RepID=A0ABS4SD18_9PROT|nr:heparan-alpha-glucosaminide N-acetyltransferase [Azospirillum rugosum]MBP2290469.1 putative membrane protein [Azospirillum rugosum]MDQ0525357.1 putative membrane protein [Azospirillum rugosum]
MLPSSFHAPTNGASRLGAVDVARGTALLAMAIYHGSWDLNFLGLARFDLLDDPLWLAARTLILGSFLLLAGVSLVLATDRGLDRRRFARRLLLLVLAAAGVSAVSFVMFPDSPIFFGVLHHIAVASVLGLAFLRLPWPVTLALGVAVVAVGETVALPLFDTPTLRWVGLMTFEPESNDYVPLFPWFGAVLFGIALGRLWRPRPAGSPRTRVGRGFAWAGRHSLAIYLIHQPMLFGTLSLVALGVGVEPLDVRNFLESCTATCANSGIEPAQCTARCRCVTEGLGRSDLWTDFINDRLNSRAQAQVDTIIQRCSAPN